MNKYNSKEIQFVGKYDYDKPSPPPKNTWHKTFSIGVFQWELRSNGKEMKKSKTKVRVGGRNENWKLMIEMAEKVVKALEANTWDGRTKVVVSSRSRE